MSGETRFSFRAAFDRNIGWLAEWEQQALRGKRVAIAGMGGVGGFHLLSLVRFGVGAFNIADLDTFEVANFNRQVGASVPTLERPKVDVMAEMALAINPGLRLKTFKNGVQPKDIDSFLTGVDLFIDGFDFFVLDIRRKVFARCAELGIPALTAAPVGMGVGIVAFTRDSMSFEDYFRFEGRSELRQYVNFLLGVAPSGIHRAYLVDPGRMDFARRKAPSTVAGVQMAASATATLAVKLLLGRAGVKAAPHHHHYDAYLGRIVNTTLRWGNNGPLQQLKGNIAERRFGKLVQLGPKPEPVCPSTPLEEIIDVARWAPSGDNSQPWRFKCLFDDTLLVSIEDHSRDNVYEYRGGEPTLISAGMLLANLEIAASAQARRMEWRYGGMEGASHAIECRFAADSLEPPDELYSYIPLRSVDRRPYRLSPLTGDEKAALSEALGDDLEVVWRQTAEQRLKTAHLVAAATAIRLRIPETFEIHRRIIDWQRRQSPSGIPAGALGLNGSTQRMMRWAMQSWDRMDRLNRIAGTFPAALQMDYLPGFFSAAYFFVRPKTASPERTPQLLAAGGHLQRFWLTATKLGIAMQPTLAPLAFAHWGRTDAAFTVDARARAAAARLAADFDAMMGRPCADLVFMGRIGRPHPLTFCRSTRLSLDELLQKSS
jgi:sulfur-carrier protein adenylyltransferase/sulfurtransferase